MLLDAGQCRAAFAELSSWPSQFPLGFSDASATLGQHLIVGHPCASQERIHQHGKAPCSSKKELKYNTTEGIAPGSRVEEREVNVMMRVGQQPTLLV